MPAVSEVKVEGGEPSTVTEAEPSVEKAEEAVKSADAPAVSEVKAEGGKPSTVTEPEPSVEKVKETQPEVQQSPQEDSPLSGKAEEKTSDAEVKPSVAVHPE